jgi:hypothetical protein
MSAENVELVRQLYDWFAGRENAKPFEVYDPEIEWDLSGFRGVDQLGFERGLSGP